MDTTLFIALAGGAGLLAGLAMGYSILLYYSREEVFNNEIRRQQDLHVSAQINSLHETIQFLRKQNGQLAKVAAVTVTRMNDTPVTVRNGNTITKVG